MPKSLKISLLAVSVVFVLCLFLGVNTRGVSAAGGQSQEGAYRQINVYGEVLQHIQNDYVEDPNIPAVTNGALRGLLESLDADSSYLTPADYKTYKEEKAGKAQVGHQRLQALRLCDRGLRDSGQPCRPCESERRRHHRGHRQPGHSRSVTGSHPADARGSSRQRAGPRRHPSAPGQAAEGCAEPRRHL